MKYHTPKSLVERVYSEGDQMVRRIEQFLGRRRQADNTGAESVSLSELEAEADKIAHRDLGMSYRDAATMFRSGEVDCRTVNPRLEMLDHLIAMARR